jgi:hypothetical protein
VGGSRAPPGVAALPAGMSALIKKKRVNQMIKPKLYCRLSLKIMITFLKKLIPFCGQ